MSPAREVKTQLDRPKVIFRPVVTGVDGRGNSVLRPTMQVPRGMRSENLPALRLAEYHQHGSQPLPPPANVAPAESHDAEEASPFVEDEMPMPVGSDFPEEYYDYGQSMGPGCAEPCSPSMYSHSDPALGWWYGLLANLHGPRAVPAGIGPENVMNALFFLDTTQPLNNWRIRGDAGKDWELPDRAEYFWAKTPDGKGPEPDLQIGEPSVNYQDLRFYLERGSDRFSVGTEIPIRAVDPVVRRNSTGLGDMTLTTKALLLDGRCWQISQIFRTWFPTGSAHRGTGNGHFSLEPGLATRYKFSDITYFHSDISYLFPIAGDSMYQGEILNAGIGISHVFIDTDRYAVIPTLELDSSTILDGAYTRPGLAPTKIEVDSDSILNLHPGVRIVCDKGCDCGTKEFGIAGGIALTEDHWYETMIRLEFRWTH